MSQMRVHVCMSMCVYVCVMFLTQVEVFEYALDATSGEDLHKVLWLKSRNSEIWLDRRTNYTRSAAVMSMVGATHTHTHTHTRAHGP